MRWEATNAKVDKLHQDQKMRGSHFDNLQDRVACLETMLGDTADMHGNWETARSQLVKVTDYFSSPSKNYPHFDNIEL